MGMGINTYTPPAVKNIIIVNVLFFLASIILPKYFNLDVIYLLGLHYFESEAFNPVQLLTYMFLHDTSGFGHIFFNMFGLWMFGRAIEQVMGPKRFLLYYFVTGVGAAIVQEVTWMFSLQPMMVTVGASGCIFGLLAAFAVLFPKAEIFLLFIPIPIKAPIFVIIYAVIELFAGVAGSGDGIAHYAHLGGLVFGLILLFIWKKQGKLYDDFNF